VKILVLGPSCSGKTTVCRHLRSERETNAIDACDEILRLNDGVWPDIGRKNDVLLPQVVERVVAMDDVVLFNSYMHRPLLERLRAAGFQTVLLRVTEVELRRRHHVRQATEGWTNVQWLEWDLDHLKTLQAGGLIDEVVSGEQDAASVAGQLLAFAHRSDVASRKNQAVEVLNALGIAHTGLTTLKDVDERQNGNWLVDTGDGKRHVLRRYHDRATSTDIAYEHAVLRHLDQAGWVVPAPIGEAVEHGGRWFCITRHVPGAPVRDESEAQRRRRGRDMARIDVALRDLGEHLGQRPGWRPQHTGPSVHEDVDWDQCLAVLGARDTRLQDWAATAAAAIAAELAAIGAAALPLTLLHGDFAEWNVHYLDGELAGAIDFALSHLDSRPHELAIARTHRSPEAIASYAEEMADLGWPLSDLEQAAIGPVHRAFRVSMTAWVIDEARNGKSLDVAMIERQLRLTGVPPP
jgi:Ser/Thr protein kinase RdoA (MazF antagonist)